PDHLQWMCTGEGQACVHTYNYIVSKGTPPAARFVDLAGPRKIASAGGALYLILFKDDATRMGWLYPLKSKSAADVTAATRKFLADVGGAVECFRTDNGTEFVNALFASLCANEKIRHGHTGVDGPKHNGVVERGLGPSRKAAWPLAWSPPGHLHERLPEHHGDDGERPFQVAARGIFWDTAAAQHPRLHAVRIPLHPPHSQV
ncbi:MAG: DDE-type integrase/transposase/recombinase, partial [Alphaproteobacteria bacterium]